MGPEHRPYLKATDYADGPGGLADELADAADPTPIIIRARAGRSVHYQLCRLTVDTFASILASEAGNLALTILATDGVYLGGGLPRRLLSILKKQKRVFCANVQTEGTPRRRARPSPVQLILILMVGLLAPALQGLSRADTLPQSSGVGGT